MTQPLVACVLLTADRPEMTQRAVRCWDSQRYERRQLIVMDTGINPCFRPTGPNIVSRWLPQHHGCPVGELRNIANSLAIEALPALPEKPDLFAHWDSDDWSHPNRLAEQVALIESDPELDAVGYSDMLFWKQEPYRSGYQDHLDDCTCGTCGPGQRRVIWSHSDLGEAWFYTSTSSYLLGTSLLYRRAAWERKPFEHVNQGEDRRWLAGLRTKGVRSIPSLRPEAQPGCKDFHAARMIASIHGGNTSSRIDPSSENWTRVPHFDEECRETMALSRVTTEVL